MSRDVGVGSFATDSTGAAHPTSSGLVPTAAIGAGQQQGRASLEITQVHVVAEGRATSAAASEVCVVFQADESVVAEVAGDPHSRGEILLTESAEAEVNDQVDAVGLN